MSLLQTLADRAGLSFDPDPTISRLVASVLHDLPRLTESLGQARARGSAVLTKGTATSTDRADLAALGQMARLHLENARFGIEQAGQGDGQIRATLAPTLAAAIEQAGKGFALIDERLVRAEELDLPAPDYFAQMTHVIDAEYQLIDRSFLLLRDQLQAREQSAVSHFGMLAGSIALLALICGWMMAVVVRQTTQNIGQALAVARTVAAGDLRSHVRVDGSDELCQLLNELGHMNAGLVDLVARLRLGADSIANGSAEIAAGNQDLSGRTETQASSLEETAASMEELASTVKLSAENARQASELARAASDAASAGGQAMTQVVTMMAEIANSSRKMADIIGVIDGIAFQTNILALNAAVEAARAGEQGRGFAVVAGEVRNLAQRSAQAAREIKDMIHDSMNQVELGSSLVTDTGSNMSDMVVRVKRVADLVGEISASAAEQSSGIAQVNEAVTQMDQLTQQNAALVEQVAAASSSLSEQANRLGQAVAVFQV
jgi:methyl-accepting chemotaxis protein